MLRLVGRMADGLLISHNYVSPDKLAEINERIDEGAEQAGRDPTEIRRGYNLMGVLDLGREDTKASGLDDNYIQGSVQEWTDKILNWYKEYSQDTFIFWPVAGNQRLQIEAFAQEIVPAVREKLHD
jgi:alkanesulfonate monooxygenase SsuD/methylene tetrahydromethanopterin reductase-like flavin-dependent oxidoreductase (luciferase family)